MQIILRFSLGLPLPVKRRHFHHVFPVFGVSVWEQSFIALCLKPLCQGGQGDSVHANADNSLLSGIWNVDHSSASVALTQGGERERGEIGIPQVPRTPY